MYIKLKNKLVLFFLLKFARKVGPFNLVSPFTHFNDNVVWKKGIPSDSRKEEGTNELTKNGQKGDLEQGEQNRGLNQQDYCKGIFFLLAIHIKL